MSRSPLALGVLAARLFGLDLSRFGRSVRGVPKFVGDLRAYSAMAGEGPFKLNWGSLTPMLSDFDEQAGSAIGQYFHQDLWAARRIYSVQPKRHVDVGSRVDGFITHLLCFMDEVEVVDIRPLDSPVRGLRFVQEDATTLASFPDGSIPSLSSLHVAEHFGLGRYGDPVDPDGWRQGMLALSRVLAPGGRLYFSVPVGVERLQFNAQRVFTPQRVVDTFGDLELHSFAAIDDRGLFRDDCELSDLANARNACGLFEFRRPESA